MHEFYTYIYIKILDSLSVKGQHKFRQKENLSYLTRMKHIDEDKFSFGLYSHIEQHSLSKRKLYLCMY